jgi:FKBP-type peptidyl-prolyl cis-trans isomerase FkpA
VVVQEFSAESITKIEKRDMKSLLTISLVLSLAACGSDAVVEPLTNEDFAAALNVDLDAMTQTASGLYWQDLEVGAGDEAVVGATIKVQYEGWLRNGTLFDTSRDTGFPFTFQLGAGFVIEGWDEGVVGMRVGGIRKLVIPPELGYGATVRGSIPANSTLVFDVELEEIVP